MLLNHQPRAIEIYCCMHTDERGRYSHLCESVFIFYTSDYYCRGAWRRGAASETGEMKGRNTLEGVGVHRVVLGIVCVGVSVRRIARTVITPTFRITESP